MRTFEKSVLWDRANNLFGRTKENWNTVDEMIYGLPDYFNYDNNKIQKIRFKAIKESVHHHYNNSVFYNQLCKEYDFKPDLLSKQEDLEKIPMLPDTFFKEYPSENPKDIFNWLEKISTVNLGNYDYKGKDLQEGCQTYLVLDVEFWILG